MTALIESLQKLYQNFAKVDATVDARISFTLPDPHGDVALYNTMQTAEDLDCLYNIEDEMVEEANTIREKHQLNALQTQPLPMDNDTFVESDDNTNSDANITTYTYAAVGGTFDHLHAGHKLLLSAAVAVARDRLVVGVTGDAMLVNKKFAAYLEPFDTRVAAVRSFIASLNPNLHVEISQLQNASGPVEFCV